MGKDSVQANRNSKNGNPRFAGLDWRDNTEAAVPVYWSDVDMAQLRLVVDALSRQGAAIILGRTSDGGALSVTVLDGDQKLRRWPKNVEEWGDLADKLVDAYTGR